MTISIGRKFFSSLTESPLAALLLYHPSLLGPGLEEMQDSQVPPDNPGQCKAQPPSLGSQQPPSKRGSSTSSGEEYCNSPSSRLPPWNSHVFSSEQDPLLEPSPNLELAGSQTTFPGKVGPGGLCACSNLPGWREHKAGSPEPGGVQDSSPNSAATCCVTLDKSLPLSGPSLPQLSS